MMGRRGLLVGAGATLALGPGVMAALEGSHYDRPQDIYAALGSQPVVSIDVGGSRIDVVFADGAPGLNRERVLRWVNLSARAMTTYFGRYPTARYGLLVVATDSADIGHATTFGYRGPVTRIHVGVNASEGSFRDDWVLVHEMTHTALPDLPRRALWLQEGNATWIEPVARAQAGQLPVSDVWRQALRGMPRGIGKIVHGGMDGTEDWGSLYWGGALFWLEAEVAIFRETKGRFLLRDALRAINRESGGNGVEWEPDRMMAIGDQVTGGSALGSLYARYAAEGPAVDLSTLFQRLGVAIADDRVFRFDSHAELAALTRRITAP